MKVSRWVILYDDVHCTVLVKITDSIAKATKGIDFKTLGNNLEVLFIYIFIKMNPFNDWIRATTTHIKVQIAVIICVKKSGTPTISIFVGNT